MMRKYFILLVAIGFWGILGCESKLPNLVVRSAAIDFSAKTVEVEVANIGDGNAGSHLTYIEINEVGAVDADKPQTQYSASISAINAGDSWNSGAVAFSSFSSPRGVDLATLISANLVVAADAKNSVEESAEDDNLYDANH